jgi:hypothetical protein
MVRNKLIATSLIVIATACAGREVDPALTAEMPRKIVWAWERPEDLEWLDPKTYGVAFLAQSLVLSRNTVEQRARRQPLRLAEGIYVIAVTRIESGTKDPARPPNYTDEQAARIASLVVNTLELPDVRAVQIDFDAAVSERDFYRRVLHEIRSTLDRSNTNGKRIPMTMTAIASWCAGETWLNDLPVDEAVPMVFVMGTDQERIRTFLRNGGDWREPLCRASYGISIDEPRLENLRPGRRIYYFKNTSWERGDLRTLGPE